MAHSRYARKLLSGLHGRPRRSPHRARCRRRLTPERAPLAPRGGVSDAPRPPAPGLASVRVELGRRESRVNVQLLIEVIVRQTTVLIAHLATTGGVRAPLSQIAG